MTNVRKFLTLKGKFVSQRLNVVPCKNLGLKLADQQLGNSIGLCLRANICVAHTCQCGKRVERDSLHGLSCTNQECWSLLATCYAHFSHKADVGISRLACDARTAFYRTDGKRPDGVTMISWEMGKQRVWDITPESRLLMQPRNHHHRG